jgi:hypothetical protein
MNDPVSTIAGIKDGLNDAVFNEISSSVKVSFVKCVEGFKSNTIKLKMLIHDLSMIVHKRATPDVFFAHELQLMRKPSQTEVIELD